MNKPTHPSNLELQALSVLWHEGPSTVSSVHESLPDGRERAYTTVLSVMQSLERKKLVRRIRSGRAHVYESAYSQEIIVRRATDDFVTNAFGGRLGEAVLAQVDDAQARGLERQQRTNEGCADRAGPADDEHRPSRDGFAQFGLVRAKILREETLVAARHVARDERLKVEGRESHGGVKSTKGALSLAHDAGAVHGARRSDDREASRAQRDLQFEGRIEVGREERNRWP